jgi:antitoxin component of RelBE/YafQ-DinJ toxin-antitoxin module
MSRDVRTPTESVAARIDTTSKDKLALAAEECDLTVSAYVETVIEEHIDRNPRNLRALESSGLEGTNKSDRSTSEGPPNKFIDKMLDELE